MIVIFAMQAECNFPVMPRARIMIESVRRYLPAAKIIQLTNDTFPMAEGVDEVLRIHNEGDFISWALKSVINVLERGEEVLQIATDVMLLKDVSEVFEKEFDTASCQYPNIDRKDGAFCGDVNFIKPAGLELWRDVYDMYKQKFDNDWEGGQSAFLEIYKRNRYNILPIDYNTYCYTPEALGEDISQAKILHFRGERKQMMEAYANSLH